MGTLAHCSVKHLLRQENAKARGSLVQLDDAPFWLLVEAGARVCAGYLHHSKQDHQEEAEQVVQSDNRKVPDQEVPKCGRNPSPPAAGGEMSAKAE